jgi:putative peptidoglycan lipid II flippase
VGLRSASQLPWSLAAVAVGQLGFIVTSRVLTRASDLAEREQVVAAGRASYDYAFLLFMLPHSLITVSLTTALFVRLASAANRGDTAEVLGDLRSGLRVPVPLTVPIAVAGVLFAPLVVRVFFTPRRRHHSRPGVLAACFSACSLRVAHLVNASLRV